MKRFFRYAVFVFIIGSLAACTAPTPGSPADAPSPTQMPPATKPAQPPLSSDEWIKPGDKIGEMTIEKEPIFNYVSLLNSCGFDWTITEPASQTVDCTVVESSKMAFGMGLSAEESKFASAWEAITWELAIDNSPVALEDFGWTDVKYQQPGLKGISRGWNIVFNNLTAGEHTISFAVTFKTVVDDGYIVSQPGKYEYIANLVVTEGSAYPSISSSSATGQHLYTSEKANLDFLLYLPEEYGKDPQQKWPLIVYLHGAHLRGVDPELIRNEPLPTKLETEPIFPFIVLAPHGEGDNDFWSTDEMIEPTFTLLEEIQSVYSVDPKRIYLVGDGMGGNGVWAIGLRHPEYFAALAPIGGYFGYPFTVPDNICDLIDVPVWAFHGGKDENVPVEAEQDLVDALNACGGSAKITVKPNETINIRHEAYENPELYEWFLSYSLK